MVKRWLLSKVKEEQIMKKIYQQPTTMVVNTKIERHLCAGSQVGIGDSYNGGTIQSRRNSDWFDDDEE